MHKVINDKDTMPPLQVVAREIPAGQYRVEKEAEGRRSNQAGNRDRDRDRGNRDLNHLLAFTLPPRQHPPPRTSRRSGRNAPSWHNTRERYLNAQYRFMLKPTGDYTVHFADPDIYFNWPDVLQVIVPTSSVLPAAAHSFEGPSTSTDSLLPSCPICLSEPVAPRMTKCGHIFCYPCLLHYLELSETGQKCRSCPICYDTVYGRDLKSVKWFDPVSAASQSEAQVPPVVLSTSDDIPSEDATHVDHADQEGDFMTMRLIHRTTISTLALPKSATWPSELIPPHAAPWHFAPDILAFSRFMLATPDYMAAELRSDLSQLHGEVDLLRKLGTPADDLGMVFIEAARRKVTEQIEKVALLRTELVERTSEAAWLDLEGLKDKESAARRRKKLAEERALASTTSAEETDEYIPPDHVLNTDNSAYAATPKQTKKGPQTSLRNTPTHPSASAANRNNRQRRNVNPPAPNDATYLFYQASSGQHIYLHPLDIKILKSHFESYSAFPLSIRVRVEGTEEGSMNEDLRKRCRYLSHLPEACDLTFVEADMTSFVPAGALAPYAQALKKRGAKRREKARRDDKARLKSEQMAAEREREAYYRSHVGGAAAIPSAPPAVDSEFVFPVLRETSSRESPASAADSQAMSGSPPKPAPSPSAGSNDRSKTVWGTRAIPASATPQAQRYDEDESLESAFDSAWNDFDSMQTRGGRRQGRKKKVVLNLSGGTVSMRR